MSKEQEFKLLSKEEIEKNRITAYKYIDMDKKPIPIEGLHILRALVESNEEHQDYRISTEVVKICLDGIEMFLAQEKEQREELIKKTYADALINLTMLEQGKISKEEMEMINKRAEQYYNEVIKRRY
jgi:hypothetical protein